MTIIGDAVSFVHFVEGVEKAVPAIVTAVKEDAHGNLIADLHVFETNARDVISDAHAAVDDVGKIIQSHFRSGSTSATAPAPPAVAAGPSVADLEAQVATLQAELAAAQATTADTAEPTETDTEPAAT
jgi:hypothetical protein